MCGLRALRGILSCGRCQAGAEAVHEKRPVQYPRKELPDKIKWGPEKWDIDYRDKTGSTAMTPARLPAKRRALRIAVQGYLKMAAQGRYRDAAGADQERKSLPGGLRACVQPAL